MMGGDSIELCASTRVGFVYFRIENMFEYALSSIVQIIVDKLLQVLLR